jgi:uncharacterized iron-regulated protein
MKTSKLAVLSFLSLSILQAACASERIFDVAASTYIARDTLLERIAKVNDVVVGEKHDTASIQNSEAALFTDFAKGRRARTTFAWEFWNWSEREVLESNFAKFRAGTITGEAFMRAVFGDKNPELTYLPILEAVKVYGADVIATNLTREEKAPVVSCGLSALDPSLLPQGFALGGAGYYDRFVEAMGGHGDPKDIANYFAAQSLVDDVAAYHFVASRTTPDAFLIIGNFHTRYFDGAWKRIEARSQPNRKRTLVEIADPGDETDWPTVLHHPKYGSVADYVIFTR